MRSQLIYHALAHGATKYEICQLVGKGVRAIHRSGSRFEDSINDVLRYIGTHEGANHGVHPTDDHTGPNIP